MHAIHHDRAIFGANRSRDGRQNSAEEKNKESKPTEKYNITEI